MRGMRGAHRIAALLLGLLSVTFAVGDSACLLLCALAPEGARHTNHGVQHTTSDADPHSTSDEAVRAKLNGTASDVCGRAAALSVEPPAPRLFARALEATPYEAAVWLAPLQQAPLGSSSRANGPPPGPLHPSQQSVLRI